MKFFSIHKILIVVFLVLVPFPTPVQGWKIGEQFLFFVSSTIKAITNEFILNNNTNDTNTSTSTSTTPLFDVLEGIVEILFLNETNNNTTEYDNNNDDISISSSIPSSIENMISTSQSPSVTPTFSSSTDGKEQNDDAGIYVDDFIFYAGDDDDNTTTDEGIPCGPQVTCKVNEYCCNESCGICMNSNSNEMCMTLACTDDMYNNQCTNDMECTSIPCYKSEEEEPCPDTVCVEGSCVILLPDINTDPDLLVTMDPPPPIESLPPSFRPSISPTTFTPTATAVAPPPVPKKGMGSSSTLPPPRGSSTTTIPTVTPTTATPTTDTPTTATPTTVTPTTAIPTTAIPTVIPTTIRVSRTPTTTTTTPTRGQPKSNTKTKTKEKL